MTKVKKYLKEILGRELSDDELTILRVAYNAGEQNVFDRIMRKEHGIQ
ncbi:hypothetical protein [Brevibacillus porteri]